MPLCGLGEICTKLRKYVVLAINMLLKLVGSRAKIVPLLILKQRHLYILKGLSLE